MQFKGTITKALPVQTGVSKSGVAWRRQEYVIQYDGGRFPKSVVFSLMNEDIDRFAIKLGHDYILELDFESREWNDRFFLSAYCWKATLLAPVTAANSMQLQPETPGSTPAYPLPEFDL